jgi:hypothetical protein
MLRELVKRVTTPDFRYTVRLQARQLRTHGPVWFGRWNAMLADAWLRDRWNRRHHYRVVAEAAVRAARKSSKVFIFGSGYSLNDLAPHEWAHFEQHDVFGFNAFYNQRWIPVGFHLLRGGIYGELRWRRYATEVGSAIASNDLYANTIFLLQDEYFAQFTNQLIGHRVFPAGRRIFRYRTARADGVPTRSFRDGILHTAGTLCDAVHCAYCLGWSDIVLVGVDLYDARYFWLPPEQTLTYDAETGGLKPAAVNAIRGLRVDEQHNTVRIGVVDLMARWRAIFEADGVSLSVYNPKSRLAGVLPVYTPPA